MTSSIYSVGQMMEDISIIGKGSTGQGSPNALTHLPGHS